MAREAGASAKAKIAEQRMAAGLHPVPPVIVDGDPVLAFAYDSLIAYACFSWPKFETAAHHMLIAKYLHKVESGEIRRLIISLPPRHGKLCADETPVLTTNGWTTHGELKVGDYVFGIDGLPTKIIAVSDKGEANVKITFCNKESIICHENHEWVVYSSANKEFQQVETNFFLEESRLKKRRALTYFNKKTGKTRYCYSIPNIKPVDFSEKELPLSPYVLGVWLGDGTAKNPVITHPVCDEIIIHEIVKEGFTVSARHIHKTTGVISTCFGGTKGKPGKLTKLIRSMGLYDNKHIPSVYKVCSIEQRLQLLAGLIDTDGYVNKDGRVIISTTIKQLRDDIIDIANSLGFRPYFSSAEACVSSSGIIGRKTVYQIGFSPTIEIPTRVPRKKTNRLIEQRKIGISSVEYIDAPKQGHCIQVDNEDGMYLVGKTLIPTHNSLLTSQFFPAWYLGRNPDKRVVIVSKSGDLASEFGRNVRNLIADPVYSEIFPGVRLSESSTAVDDFNLELPYRGGCFTVGVGGMLSGRGANCVVGETKVETENGPIDIATLYLMEEKPRVLSYNHAIKQLEYKPIIATKQSKTDYLMEFFTRAGNNIRVTKEHQIFHPSHGYLEAKEFVFGDEMYCIPVGSSEKIGTKQLPELERSLLSEIGRLHYHKDDITVYDIQVEDNENFFANGILVHNCLILDDTVRDRADAESETQQKKIMDWYTSTAYTRLMDNGSIVICNTRWTCNDLCGQLIRDHKHEDWVVLNLPAISYIDGKEEALWPEKYPLEELHRIKKTLPARDWEALYQQKPFVSEGGIFKREWWQKLSGYKAPECSFIIQSYDTAYSTKDVKRNSFSARTTWGVFQRPDDEVPNVLLLEAWQDHLEYPELRKEVLRAYKEYQPDKVIIEDKASGAILIQELRRAGVPVTAWNPQGSKQQRAKELTTAYVTQSLFENGRVFHPDRRWAYDVIDEMCCVAGTKIITIDGVLPIEDIKIGDLVLTHKGRFRPVLSLLNRKANNLIKISGKTLDDIVITDNHPFYTVTLDRNRLPGNKEWTNAGDIVQRKYAERNRGGRLFVEPTQDQHTAVLLPIHKQEEMIEYIDLRDFIRIPESKKFELYENNNNEFRSSHHKSSSIKWEQKLDFRFGRFIGLYLAEGCFARTYGASFSFNATTEQHLVDEIFNFSKERFGDVSIQKQNTKNNCTIIKVRLPLLEDFFYTLGKGAINKKIPAWAWDSPDDFAKGIISGVLDGDGDHYKGVNRITSISESLVWGIRLLLLRFGVNAITYRGKEESVRDIQGTNCSCKQVYKASWVESPKTKGASVFIGDHVAYSVMKTDKYEKSDEVEVFNLEVFEDNSYTTTGGIVHNCQFPNGAHDDIVDTIVQALTWLQKSWLVHHSDLKEEEEKDTIDEEDDDFLGKNVTRFRAKRKRIGYG